jgi:4-alpha-glucanotransferase
LGYTGTDGSELNWDYIQRVWQSRARLAIAPLQDVIGLGSEARMNAPGKVGDFWTWRFSWDALTDVAQDRLKRVTSASGR